MKIFLVLFLLSWIAFIVYWVHPRSRGTWLKRKIRSIFGYHEGVTQPFYRSNRFLGIIMHANPFPHELNISPMGVMIIRRPFHGLSCSKVCYPLPMVKMVSIDEYLGRFAKVNLLIEVSSTHNVSIRIRRFFSANDARLFYRSWITYMHRGE